MQSAKQDKEQVDIPDWYDDDLKQFLHEQNDGSKPAKQPTKEQQARLTIQKFMWELYQARVKRHITQTDLAKKAGLTQSALARLENSKVSPTLKTLTKLAAALDMELRLVQPER